LAMWVGANDGDLRKMVARVLWGAREKRGTRDGKRPGCLLRENPRLQLQGDDTSDGAVFSVQHLFCFFEETQVCASHSDPLGASL
jgi:hypothetical protein